MDSLLFTQPLIGRIALKLSKHFPIQLGEEGLASEYMHTEQLDLKTLLTVYVYIVFYYSQTHDKTCNYRLFSSLIILFIVFLY